MHFQGACEDWLNVFNISNDLSFLTPSDFGADSCYVHAHTAIYERIVLKCWLPKRHSF
jgi:hypothetical protein